MNIVAIQTARAGSKSVPNKNIMKINHRPLFLYNIEEAKRSKYVNKVYCSTDCKTINAYSEVYGFEVIKRPQELCMDDSPHQIAMIHAIDYIEHKEDTTIDIVVLLLGNSCGARAEDIDSSIEILMNDDRYDSVQSVSELNMFNPFRAFTIKDNKLETIVSQKQIADNARLKNINDKNSCGDVYFFNGSFWVCRKSSILNNNGMLPFTWLGNNVYPFIQPPVFELDARWQIDLMKKRY